MTDRPIIFSAEMVRALLDGRKSQTCRVLKPPYGTLELTRNGWKPIYTKAFKGDRLWVREQCATWVGTIRDVVYRADETAGEWDNIRHDAAFGHWKLRSPIFCPRWASRLTLTVTDVRVQRVQDISEADARAEGVCETAFWERAEHKVSAGAPWSVDRLAFADLWASIHGPEAWAANPWVAAMTFTAHRHNIDQMEPTND